MINANCLHLSAIFGNTAGVKIVLSHLISHTKVCIVSERACLPG